MRRTLLGSTFLLSGSILLFLGCGSTISGGGGSAGNGGSGVTVFDDCSGPGQCGLTANTCCGVCGAPAVTNMTAVNTTLADAYRMAMCPTPSPCPECAMQRNANLFAYCDANKCVAADVSQHAFSQCNTAADCFLRFGLGCCESCVGNTFDLVALNTTAKSQVSQTVCDPKTACPDCAPIYPSGYKADCMAGHCVVVGP